MCSEAYIGSTQTVSISGTGSGSSVALVVSPTSLNFGSVQVRDNPTKVITVSNPTAVSFRLAGVQIGGTGFAIKSKTCATSLAAGASCTVTVEFAPTAAVNYSGTVRITDSAGSVKQISLSGIGTP
jgi:hypothetical protein